MPLSFWQAAFLLAALVFLAVGALNVLQRQSAQRHAAALLTCPQCRTAGALELHTREHTQDGRVATDQAIESCSTCSYESTPFTLKYPLDAQISLLLGHDDQAGRIARRAAVDAWLRYKRDRATSA